LGLIETYLDIALRTLVALPIVISVFRRYEKPKEKKSAQSEKIRNGFWVPIY